MLCFPSLLELAGKALTILGLASMIRCFRLHCLLHETGLAVQVEGALLKWSKGHPISPGGSKEPGGAAFFH